MSWPALEMDIDKKFTINNAKPQDWGMPLSNQADIGKSPESCRKIICCRASVAID
jgi:hypothetical protein